MDKDLKMMNILCSFDNGYSPYAGAMLTSLFENNKDSSITVYALTDHLDADNLRKFESLAELYSQNIVVKYVDKSLFDGLPFGGKFENISLAAYYRLLVSEILPSEVKRILYLDCDIIINGSLKELFTCEFGEQWQIVGLRDTPYVAKASSLRLGLSDNELYINSGVMLLNVEKLREINFTKRAFQFIQCNMDKIIYHDQDVINAVLSHKEILPLKYNVLECTLMKTPVVDECYFTEIDDATKNPIVIHFSGVRKPWYVECNHPYKYLYEHYLIFSPWKCTPAIYKYKSWQSKIFFWIKTILKYMLLIIGNGKYVYKNIHKN